MLNHFEIPFLKVLLFSTFVLAMVGGTPSVEEKLLVPAVLVLFSAALLVSWRIPTSLPAPVLFVIFSIAYIIAVSLVTSADYTLLARNGAFILVFPIYLAIFRSRRCSRAFSRYFHSILFLMFSLLMYRFIVLEGFEWDSDSGRVIFGDYSIADTAVLVFLAAALVYGGWPGMIYAVVLTVLIAGFGVRLNAMIGAAIMGHFVFKKYGAFKFFAGAILPGYFFIVKMQPSSLFIFEKMAEYGAGYKFDEFFNLAPHLSLDVLAFPHGLNHRFYLGVFDVGVYFSHWFVLYLLFVGGLIGFIFYLCVSGFAIYAFFLGFRDSGCNRVALLMAYVSMSILPAISVQATFKSLTFGGAVITILAFVSSAKRLRKGPLGAAS